MSVMIKKIFILLIVCVFHSQCFATGQSPLKVDDNSQFVFNIISESDKTVSVSAKTNELSGDITIPATVDIYGITYNVISIAKYAFNYCTNLTSVTIPGSVTSIGESAFYSCTGLISVTIPDSVTSIGDYAFFLCSGLTSVTIPGSVTSIGYAAFTLCSGLTTINVDKNNNNYADIDGVLYNKGITALLKCPETRTSVTIPNSVTSIYHGALWGCSGLTSVTIPGSVFYIGNYAFLDCSGLTSVTLPTSVTSIGVAAFENCTGLTSITIPSSVTSIDYGAFWGCSGLTSVTIPGSVSTIGDFAFAGCNSLTSVYYAAEEPISGNENIFSNYTKPTLFVPAAAVEKCKQIDPWKNFSNIEAFNFSGIEDLTVDFDFEKPCEVYSLNGVLIGNSIDNLPSGVYIVRQGAIVKKIAVK